MLPRFIQPRAAPRNLHTQFLFTPTFGNRCRFGGERVYGTHDHRTFVDMDKAYLRNATNTEELHITFRYVNESLHVDRDFNFCRRMNERIGDALGRIRNNVEKEFNKRLKKNKAHSSDDGANPKSQLAAIVNENKIELYRDGSEDLLTGLTFAEVLGDVVSGLKLRVLDKKFDIVFNEPWTLSLHLPRCILAGHLVYPNKLELQFATRESCLGTWYKALMPSSGDLHKSADWKLCGQGLFYEVKKEDIGFYLKLVLIPRNEKGQQGPTAEHIAKWPVQPGPGECPFEIRHSYTAKQLCNPNEIRVVSYNLLADMYADSDYSRTTLFPYCLPHALEIDYRKQLFIKELVGYNADLLCLQEVDLKIFDFDLKTVLELLPDKFYGIMAPKGTCLEGVAIFYRYSRFQLLNTFVLHLGDNLDRLPIFAPLWNKIKGNQRLANRIRDRSTTLELCLFKIKKTEHYVLLANTHLYFHPDADHIRLLQMGFCLLYVHHVYLQSMKEQNITDPNNVGVIFCGDFNSVPECGIYKLMTEQFVGSDFVDWTSNPAEVVTDVELNQPFDMKSACGTPQFTNFTTLFSGCLDYIFYQSDRFELIQSVPLPTYEELTVHKAIPSITFPSDHVALVADLRFKPSC